MPVSIRTRGIVLGPDFFDDASGEAFAGNVGVLLDDPNNIGAMVASSALVDRQNTLESVVACRGARQKCRLVIAAGKEELVQRSESAQSEVDSLEQALANIESKLDRARATLKQVTSKRAEAAGLLRDVKIHVAGDRLYQLVFGDEIDSALEAHI
ncbi:MAG: hypothetical protein ABGZ17_02325 [Planctomycetaceae bacterium]